MKKNIMLLIILCLTFFSFTACNKTTCENGHTWGDETTVVEATCETKGEVSYTCLVCGKTKTETTDLIPHQMSSTWTISDDTHYHLCTICGKYKEDVAKHEYNDEGLCECGKTLDGFRVSFDLDENVTVYVYNTQDTSSDGIKYENGMTLFARLSTGEISKTTDEQINFKIEIKDGFTLDTIEATLGAYKNIKNISDNIYRVTKINQDITIKITTKIDKIAVDKLTATNNVLSYTGELLKFIPEGFDEEIMEITNNEEVSIGSYEAIISLKNKEMYCWSDFTTDDLVIPYSIVKGIVEVEVPKASNVIFVYNGEVQKYIPTGFNEGIMNIENNLQTESGTYTVLVTLKDNVNYVFSNNEEEIKFTFIINKCMLTKPTESLNQYYYTSSEIDYIPSGFIEDFMEIKGNNEINVGSYFVTISLIDKANFIWDDETTDDVIIEYQILPKILVKPTNSNNILTYTTNLLTYLPSGFNDEYMEISNNEQTEVGSYEIIISLRDKINYVWSDLSTDDVVMSFSITEKELPYKITQVSSTKIKISYSLDGTTYDATIAYLEGVTYDLNQDTGKLTFSYLGTLSSLTFDFSGSYFGGITFNVSSDVSLEINLSGMTITSYQDAPLVIQEANEVDISAKKGTANYIYDYRTEEGDANAAIYSTCDLLLKGTGSLEVVSENLLGIHTKDDLTIQKLTLLVNAYDHALKGNDSVEIKSGTITVISQTADGIKTSNTALSKKGKQKGNVIISDGTIEIYAACDGIDAACNVTINGGTILINTDSYSSYSKEVTKVDDDVYYLKTTSLSYKYAVYYYNDENMGEWVIPSTYDTVGGGRNTYYYYEVKKLASYQYLKVYIYSSIQTPGSTESYYKVSNQMTLNNSYDTIEITQNRFNNTTSFNWTIKTTNNGGGMFPNEGNSDKKSYSTKGIKAGNEIVISNGNITINAYDDAIHTNNDETFESGLTPTGNITVEGGVLVLTTHDDGIHADGTVKINGGTIKVLTSYEGIEGDVVIINDGTISITSSDDGINGTNTNSTSIIINGGLIYIYAGGDGVDSNTQVSYNGINFNGGKMVIISVGMSDSSIDTEKGYSYTGGIIIGISRSGGMSNESTKCTSFSSIGTSKTISLTKDQYLSIDDVAEIKMPTSINALVVVLCEKSLNISSLQTSSSVFDENGVCFKR